MLEPVANTSNVSRLAVGREQQTDSAVEPAVLPPAATDLNSCRIKLNSRAVQSVSVGSEGASVVPAAGKQQRCLGMPPARVLC